jgi:Fe-S cluster assembly ATP-binding protein
MLKIDNLHVVTESGKEILKGLTLNVNPGEIHAIMGPNGAGKSTLSHVIAGKPGYSVSKGELLYKGSDLTELEAHERAQQGIFLAFQYPVEIPGVNAMQFLRESVNARRTANGKAALNGAEFLKLMRAKQEELKIDSTFLQRDVNSGFSGGEKKRFEILQMALLEPSLCVLDETDSGLDIDALKIVADGINALRNEGRSFVMITHYPRLLELVQPDFVHVLADGRIAKTGCDELAYELEKMGYADVATHAEASA